MMEPPPASRIAGITSRVPRNTPLTLMSMVRSHCSAVMSSMPPRVEMPALLTRMSTLPKRDTAAATALRQSSSLVTSR